MRLVPRRARQGSRPVPSNRMPSSVGLHTMVQTINSKSPTAPLRGRLVSRVPRTLTTRLPAKGCGSFFPMKSPEELEAYFTSSEWRRRAISAIGRSGGKCLLCCAYAVLHVHCNNPASVGCEEPDDLAVLCSGCHGVFHDRTRFPWESHITQYAFGKLTVRQFDESLAHDAA